MHEIVSKHKGCYKTVASPLKNSWAGAQAGDLAEYRAIRAAIPGSDVRINGTKSMIGHLLGAAGAVEAIATIQAIRTGALPLLHSSSSCAHKTWRLLTCKTFEGPVLSHEVSNHARLGTHVLQGSLCISAVPC